MNNKLYMHQTTFDWLKRNITNYHSSVTTFYCGNSLSFSGYDIIISDTLSETIDEVTGWIFPKEPFVRYEQKDREWCEYFGIGRKGRGFILGEVVSIPEHNFLIKAYQPRKKRYLYW